MKKGILTLMLATMLAIPAFADDKQPITLEVEAEKEMMVVENGQEVIKRVPARSIEPGQVIFYTLTYSNRSDTVATNVVFNDPVPEETVYIDRSAYGDNSIITYSVDGGSAYGDIAALTVADKESGQQRPATAEDITHIRWRVTSIPPKTAGELGFRVRVK